ncbi:unnamed protein product [Fraxinus pennsylvanica]|uniref:Uncharacterized protein n=1 Tax=Fraxinus pennsylvanica TaxID=56036 RepID=A0AAD2DM88_9LAMI|nr:unnamed protein product [Fraxinus pennsylvanica]
MKITREKSKFQETHFPKVPSNSSLKSDLSFKPTIPRKPPHRKTKTTGIGVRLKRETGAPSGKRSSRPETPLLRWKFDDKNDNNASIKKEKSSVEVGRKSSRRIRNMVSARKLGGALWRIPSSEFLNKGGQSLGFQFGNAHVGDSIHGDHVTEVHSSYAKDLVHSPHSVSGRKNGLLHKFEPSFQVFNSMEGATKWDPVGWKTSDALKQAFGRSVLNQRTNAAPVISALEVELEQARSRINELETERRSSKKKLEQFLQKLSEERTAWRSREHEKIRSVINDIKADLIREKKNRQRLEMVNSKLVNELNDVKLSAKRYMQDYEKERKSRELIEEVCDELARELGEDKADTEALKRESMKLQEEVEEDRKMLQMAEVWREERVQMKLVDAKAMLEEKYSQMSRLMVDLEDFLNSRSASSHVDEMKKAEFLLQAAASVDIQDIRELKYEPPNPDDIFSAFEDVNFGALIEKEADPRVSYSHGSHASEIHTMSPEVNVFNKDDAWRHSNAYFDQSGEIEDDTSEWETVSHLDDQGSSYSPDRSDPRVDKNDQTPVTDVSEVCSVPTRHRKKVSSISRLWRSYPSNGDNHKIISIEGINGLSDHGSAKGLSPQDSVGQLSSPDLGNPNITQGMKGCIEWPRYAQKNSLKAKLLAARMESQKIQLRHVLKQKY